jgi:hypothetical protein
MKAILILGVVAVLVAGAYCAGRIAHLSAALDKSW